MTHDRRELTTTPMDTAIKAMFDRRTDRADAAGLRARGPRRRHHLRAAGTRLATRSPTAPLGLTRVLVLALVTAAVVGLGVLGAGVLQRPRPAPSGLAADFVRPFEYAIPVDSGMRLTERPRFEIRCLGGRERPPTPRRWFGIELRGVRPLVTEARGVVVASVRAGSWSHSSSGRFGNPDDAGGVHRQSPRYLGCPHGRDRRDDARRTTKLERDAARDRRHRCPRDRGELGRDLCGDDQPGWAHRRRGRWSDRLRPELGTNARRPERMVTGRRRIRRIDPFPSRGSAMTRTLRSTIRPRAGGRHLRLCRPQPLDTGHRITAYGYGLCGAIGFRGCWLRPPFRRGHRPAARAWLLSDRSSVRCGVLDRFSDGVDLEVLVERRCLVPEHRRQRRRRRSIVTIDRIDTGLRRSLPRWADHAAIEATVDATVTALTNMVGFTPGPVWDVVIAGTAWEVGRTPEHDRNGAGRLQ